MKALIMRRRSQKTDNEHIGLSERDVTVMINYPMTGHASDVHRMSPCEADTCNEACYQRGGYAGGICDDNVCKCMEGPTIVKNKGNYI